jgi:hypothetical protein
LTERNTCDKIPLSIIHPRVACSPAKHAERQE